MNLPMSWLSDYTDITGVTPKEYADRITMSGSKVEGVKNLGADIDKVVVGKVLSCEDHPDSDHLHVCMVDVGEEEPIQIVCGAPNVASGQKVPVALNGSTLPGGIKIKKGKLRGVMSNGMICAADEMGIDSSRLGYEPEYGILVLPEEAEIGSDLKDLFGLNENVVEFEITSNRPDCFSIIGLARETAATFGKPFNVPKPKFEEKDGDIKDMISVNISDKDKCKRYTARVVKNVKIAPSPKWMRERLEASGVRAINNIVDITNYVLLEYGQPMHAFDIRDLKGAAINVRRAAPGEVIKTLDEEDRKLTENDLVIADAERAVAIAGVMGGFNSEIKDDTTTVVFESAMFDAASVRLTAQRVGLRTESSARFEKGLDYHNTVPAINRACELVEELCCGENVKGMIDIMGNVEEPVEIEFRPEKINAFLGTDISEEEMIKIFDALEIKVEGNKLYPPSFRPDLLAEADIAEEVARFYGYDRIPTTLMSGATTTGIKTPEQKTQSEIEETLLAQGMYEIYTYTFESPSVADKLGLPEESPLRNQVRIRNPLGEDTSVMRTTMAGSMLDILSRNYNHRAKSARLFEIGRVYIPTEEGQLPDEKPTLMLGMFGGVDFYDIKGAVEEVFKKLHIDNVDYERVTDDPTYHPGRTARIIVNGRYAGIIGEVHPAVLRRYEIGARAYIGELDFRVIHNASNKRDIKYTPLTRFPAVTRDFSILIDRITPVAEIEKVMKKAAGKLLTQLELVEVYTGEQIADDKKSVMYKAQFRAPDRSLTGEEADNLHSKIVKGLLTQLGAELR
ncbi:MAG: phenylalanine--tRNA ligase subunit beta [Clostridia bacterium]|nr:phenylalanine--tRNA ligase subunit beta [Clostridia bacterium]